MKIFDPSILELPFFDEGHRRLAAALEAWTEEHAAGLPTAATADVRDCGRRITRTLGAAGWFEHVAGRGREAGRPPVDFRSVCLIREAFAYVGDLVDFQFAIQGLACAPLVYYGTEAQRAEHLPAMLTGERVGSLALSEPDAGSDLAAVRTRAARVGDRYVLNGVKTWTSNGNIADAHCVLARTGDGGGAFGLSFFLVPATAPGLTVQDIELTAGRPFASLAFEECAVPAGNLIGAPGQGFQYAMEILDRYRITVGAAAIGFCRRAMRAALDWSKSRKVFGAPLFDQQMTKDKLAGMAVYLDAASLLVARAAWEVDRGQRRFSRHASVAKLYATDAAQPVIDDCLQLFGAAGLVKDSIPEMLYRQVRSLRIYEGTSEIQKLIIANSLR